MRWYCLWLHIIICWVQYNAGFCQYLVGNNSVQTHRLCHKEESLWLLQLKQSLLPQPPQQMEMHFMCYGPIPKAIFTNYSKLMSWNQKRRDCCLWDGVTCDRSSGHVVGLNLSCSALRGTIDSNSTLFRLTHLRSLNLGYNYLEAESFKFGELNSLTYLSLSSLIFYGEIPNEFYHLSNLAFLDITGVRHSSSMIKLDIKRLLGNMSDLREVFLNGVNISSELPINFSSSLTSLDLSETELRGYLPAGIFEMPALQFLNLGGNDLIGYLPSFNRSSVRRLEQLYLYGTSISGRLPDSVGLMTNLKSMHLYGCKFSGPIPDSIGNLTQITEMDLSGNELSGEVPSTVSNLRQLTSLDLSRNHLQGQLPDAFSHLQNLTNVNLQSNGLTGVIPSSLTNISQLQYLYLASNKLRGQIPTSLSNMSNLIYLYLSSNNLTGPLTLGAGTGLQNLTDFILSGNYIRGTVPSWLLTLPSLQYLDLSYNRLSGEIDKFNSHSLGEVYLSYNQLNIQHDSFYNLTVLRRLSLSHNTITEHHHGLVNLTLPPSLDTLELSTCEIKEFSISLKNLTNLRDLDLSMNYLTNASNLPWHQLQGLVSLDLHSNSFQGTIPSSICNMTHLSILNLSTNKFTGTIPECDGNIFVNLYILDLRLNQLQGKIPPAFIGGKFSQLLSLGLNDNQFEGPLPLSLVNCTNLEVIDVGNNMIRDTFPWWLGNLTSLKVLILKSNNFHVPLVSNNLISNLQVIDLSDNNFTGILPNEFFARLEAMKRRSEDATSGSYLGIRGYDFSMTLTVKGFEVEFTKVLRIFTTIDLSRNNFHGHIPEAITDLSFLRLLNLSHNNINGTIPGALGRMIKLEHLDLSSNQLTGGIPPTLMSLTFLAVLNLSQNHLVGQIPMGNQFETFSNDSYIGNSGLCGFPLTKRCGDGKEPPAAGGLYDDEEEDSGIMGGFTWKAVVMGYGCGIVLGFVLGYVMVSIGKPECVARFVYVEAAIILKRRK